MYKCKYISQWKREFPFIEAVKEIHTGKFKKNYFKLIIWLDKLFSRTVVKYLVG